MEGKNNAHFELGRWVGLDFCSLLRVATVFFSRQREARCRNLVQSEMLERLNRQL